MWLCLIEPHFHFRNTCLYHKLIELVDQLAVVTQLNSKHIFVAFSAGVEDMDGQMSCLTSNNEMTCILVGE